MDIKKFTNIVRNNKYIFIAAGILETIRRDDKCTFDKYVGNGLHIYDQNMINIYYKLFSDFYNFTDRINVPIIYWSTTWRTNLDRVNKSKAPKTINSDAANFLNNWRNNQSDNSDNILFGGVIGSLGDCYKPNSILTRKYAAKHHEWQIESMINSNFDFLCPITMPSVSEVMGICDLMQNSKMPYIISFVINSSGKILDGTSLEDAFKRIDSISNNNTPVGYMINCSYPKFLNVSNLSKYVTDRLIGYSANASSKDFSKLDASNALHKNNINDWLEGMVDIYYNTHINILGGCCGTDLNYLKKLFLKL
jgi:homocysteine S-methyltransferase